MAPTTERDFTDEIAYLTRALKAPLLRDAADRLAERARAESWTHQEYLAACLQREVAARDAHGGEGRIRAARLPARKSLEEFDFDHASSASTSGEDARAIRSSVSSRYRCNSEYGTQSRLPTFTARISLARILRVMVARWKPSRRAICPEVSSDRSSTTCSGAASPHASPTSSLASPDRPAYLAGG
jgi:hypothetical protein